MVEFIQQHIPSGVPLEAKVNKVREILQLLTLKILQDKRCFEHIAFVGGTALRVLYNLRRFSEDLDFSVINKDNYDFSSIITTLKHEFTLYGLEVAAKTKVTKTVQSSMLKFPRLLNDLNLSNHKEQRLSIKVEVDSNLPSGWEIENTLVNKVYLLNITHFKISSLYSTKIHACFFRRYVKGRDFYDFLWYLSRKEKPNYLLLNNAIAQTESKNYGLSESNIKDFLLERAAKIDFNAIRKDVERFLEDKGELNFLNIATVSKCIEDAFGV